MLKLSCQEIFLMSNLVIAYHNISQNLTNKLKYSSTREIACFEITLWMQLQYNYTRKWDNAKVAMATGV